MKVLLLSVDDIKGGAPRAAYRLHQGLLNNNVDSQMLVQGKYSGDKTILGSETKIAKGLALVKPAIDALPFAIYRQRQLNPYSCQWIPDKIAPQIEAIAPDVINLHWIRGGFLRIETIAKLPTPIVWTLHDMWAFTGGCAYTEECTRYTQSCGACPQLKSDREQDITRWIWRRKAKAWKNQEINIVTPSKWLAECARKSSLFCQSRIEVIANGIDIDRYKPVAKNLARDLLVLPPDKKLILFGAIGATATPRKGFKLLLSALQKLAQIITKPKDIELVVFGAFEPQEVPNFGFKARYLGKLNDDVALNLLYNAADVFVAPSLQDNFPNTILEALACGTPCAAFHIGGMPDAIAHLENGYLAKAFEVEDLARGIEWILSDRDRHNSLSQQARIKVEQNFTQDIQATKYIKLFEELKSK
jgi:glycosyltransferase involved in cell wall biosynthesis